MCIVRSRLGKPYFFFFFNDTATTEIYTLSLHDALPISKHSKNPHALAVLLFVRSDNTIVLVKSRSEEHTSELQSQSISYAVFCLKKKKDTRSVREHTPGHTRLRASSGRSLVCLACSLQT